MTDYSLVTSRTEKTRKSFKKGERKKNMRKSFVMMSSSERNGKDVSICGFWNLNRSLWLNVSMQITGIPTRNIIYYGDLCLFYLSIDA